MPTVCIDWDDTLVGYKKHPPGWLPGAQEALRVFKRAGLTVVIHSCRANWPEGLAEIQQTLADAGFQLGSKLKIHTEPGKPLGVVYIDDRAHRFTGDWASTLAEVADIEQPVRGERATPPRPRAVSTPRRGTTVNGIVVY